MPVIESKGLFRGKRLRSITPLAHLLWPFIFSLASEVYARLELDYELLADDLRRFREYVPDDKAVEDFISQYAQADLCFVYEVDGEQWAQFDKPNELRRMFPTAEDAATPAPPEPAFSEWLEKVHGKEWQNWHFAMHVSKVSAARSEAGKKGAAARWQKEVADSTPDSLDNVPPMANDGKPVKVVGVGTGIGIGKGIGKTVGSAISSTTQLAGTDKPKPFQEDAEWLLKEWEALTKEEGDIEPLRKLLEDGNGDAAAATVLHWAFTESDYWFKTPKGQIDGTEGFRKAYNLIRYQYEKFEEKSRKARATKKVEQPADNCPHGVPKDLEHWCVACDGPEETIAVDDSDDGGL